jgi:MFS family permease
MDRNRITIGFLNAGHGLDHLMMLIFPTVVLAMAPQFGMNYRAMLPLALGGFIAFGAGSLPAGWLGDHWGRRPMMILFFVGIGLAGMVTGLANSPWQIFLGLGCIGLFASIYHPVGIAMLVKDQARTGRALGWNGLWGNLGVGFAALAAGGLADLVSWRAAFMVPGAAAVLVGIAFAILVPRAPAPASQVAGGRKRAVHDQEVRRIFLLLTIATICGGIIFNATTIAMPKLFEERLHALADTNFGVGALVCFVYVIAALAQLVVGRLIDGRPLRAVFLPIAAVQVPLLLLGGGLQDMAMLIAAVAIMFAVFGLIPVTDAMVARYAHDAWRSRIYAVRYLVSFLASSLAVPLVAFMPPAATGYVALFAVLGVVALCTLGAALVFPGGAHSSVQPVPASTGGD